MTSGVRDTRLSVVAGERLESRVCCTGVVVLQAGSTLVALNCGGVPMKPGRVVACGAANRPEASQVRTIAGRVYCDQITGTRLRCTKSGLGVLTIDGRELVVEHVARTVSELSTR
jgi:hypothetical protein